MNKLTISILKYGWAALLLAILATACKKDDHFMGGSITNERTDLTTYDYLKTNPLFDTLILLINKAGLKDQINSNITFFAPTDFAIRELVKRRTTELQKEKKDENIYYTLDSFPVNELRDSLLAYTFKGAIVRDDLSLDAQVYKNQKGEDFGIRLRQSTDYSKVFSKPVRYLSITKLINGLDPEPRPEDYPDKDKDKESMLQTSGIITRTGVLHVIENTHVFYWR
ncbi:fasciclin domain-containing protein [Chitinophaga nivalis]|uniref:Fasciclin domain-containing protein n=1 Tax=Chitinophaga nivalis TaxID=2991709 RepID=A0ABT3IQI4_9BACT|nr:fasciclin domain-containing protein [Chitinophaga nivalis]MCW3464058.1 fasciclin domain-containing protein [Chitinophaga nivalis]MCW3486252.1 fasciclin domain-containing protein [Chitinophaga nivalis]